MRLGVEFTDSPKTSPPWAACAMSLDRGQWGRRRLADPPGVLDLGQEGVIRLPRPASAQRQRCERRVVLPALPPLPVTMCSLGSQYMLCGFSCPLLASGAMPSDEPGTPCPWWLPGGHGGTVRARCLLPASRRSALVLPIG